MLTQCIRSVKTVKRTSVDIGNADSRGFTQGSQAQVIFRLTAFNQPQSLAQNFAGILVAPR